MSFSPSTPICLCRVPFDNTYKHQIYFDTHEEQNSYFNTLEFRTVLRDYTCVRRTSPDGSLRSSVKVAMSIDDVQNYNYMYFENFINNTYNKTIYCFITQLIYISEKTTEIVFETDVYQTWWDSFILRPSFVVREHSKTDEIGDNLVPEKFNLSDYLVYEYPDVFDDNFDEWIYLIGATENLVDDEERGYIMTGVYQGLFFYTAPDKLIINSTLKQLEKKGQDCIVFITLVPKLIFDGYDPSSYIGLLFESSTPVNKIIDFNLSDTSYIRPTDKGYKYKNNKLYTYPFYKFVVTNHSGQTAEYSMEDFENPEDANFRLRADISANPTITLYPMNYKGVDENLDCGISISGFPQCSFNNDTFKLWLAKNQYSLGIDTVANIGSIVGGIGMMATGMGASIGAGMAISGVSGVLNTMNTVHQASLEPNKTTTGCPKNNLLTAMGKNKFDFQIHYLRYDQAKSIDDFFTMYGYQVNKVKQPNERVRQYWTYLQTMDVNIDASVGVYSVPQDDLMKIKAMYNNGVTLWNGATLIDENFNLYAYNTLDNVPL